MSSLSRIPAAVPVAALPALSQSLEAAILRVLNPHPDIGPESIALPPAVIAEARRAAAALDAVCCPAPSRQVRSWLAGINAGVANPLSATDFDMRCAAITALVGDMPGIVFSLKTQRWAMAAFKFFPSAAEVHGLLRAEASPLIAKRRALETLTPAQPPRPIMCAEERAAIADRMASLVTELRAGQPDTRRPAVKPNHLTAAQLAQGRTAAGIVLPVKHESRTVG